MIDIKNIFPECFSDTLLVELILNRGKANHKKNISKVVNALKDKSDSNEKLVGVVDYDVFKKTFIYNKYLNVFSQIVEDKESLDASLRILKIPTKNHFVIFIKPEFEPWIWKQAELANVKNFDFNIKDLEDLYKKSKHQKNGINLDLKKFVNAVVMANPPGIKLLREYLT